MGRRSEYGASDELAGAIAGIVGLVTVLGLLLLAVVVIGVLMELVRVYQTRTQESSPIARPLRQALMGLGAFLAALALICLVSPILVAPMLVVGAWGLLAFVVAVLALEGREQRRERAELGDPTDVATYLGGLGTVPTLTAPASPIPADMRRNGKAPSVAGVHP